MKKNFTQVIFYILIICTGCIATASAQFVGRVIKQFPFYESKNIFKRHDVKQLFQHEKTDLPALNNNPRGASMSSLVQILDSAYFWSWDTIALAWMPGPYGKFINYIYNSNNKLLSYEGQEWNGSAWVNSFRTSQTYDLNNNRTNMLQQQWNGTAWENNYQHAWTYDVNNNMLSYLAQDWNGSSWDNQWQDIHTYDANNNRLTDLYQFWNGTGWDNTNQSLHSYDVNNNRIFTLNQSWSGAWMDNSRDSLVYDVNNNCIYILVQSWDGLSWNDNSQQFYTYDLNNNLTYWIYQDWNGSAWINTYQENDIYDANNNLLSYLFQTWDGVAWISEFYASMTYDINNFYVSEAYRSFDATGTYFTEGDSIYYYYHTVPSSVAYNAAFDDDQIILFPIPAQNKLQITGKLLQTVQEAEIFDVQGRSVLKQFFFPNEISSQLTIDVSKLNPGIYFAAFNCGDRNYRARFLIGK